MWMPGSFFGIFTIKLVSSVFCVDCVSNDKISCDFLFNDEKCSIPNKINIVKMAIEINNKIFLRIVKISFHYINKIYHITTKKAIVKNV